MVAHTYAKGSKIQNEYIYTGGELPRINKEEHPKFILNYQASILLALVKRKLLTHSQYEKCVDALKRQSK